MTDLLRIHKIEIAKIYLVAGLSLSLLTCSFYFLGYKPLRTRLETEHTYELAHFLDSRVWLLQQIINKHFDLANQSASRTAIRKKQVAYLNASVSLDDLIAFSKPKLADAMRANKDMVGISRFDPTGLLLFSVGEPLPVGIAASCDLTNLDRIRLLRPVLFGTNQRRLIYCSPIFDREAGRVGTDILIMKDDSIRQVINAPYQHENNSIISGIVSNGEIIYWPDTQYDPVDKRVLKTFIETNDATPGYIIRSKQLEQDDWNVYVVVNRERFFAEIKQQQLILLAVIGAVAVLLFALTIVALRPIIRTLSNEKKLLELSQRDGLTGLYNQTHMQELLDCELARASRYSQQLSIIMLDIDHFKQINDTYGHQAGDEALKKLTIVLNHCTRIQDTTARYGGEEFMLILPETGTGGARLFAERLRETVAATQFTYGKAAFSFTISLGIVSYSAAMGPVEKRSLIEMADTALYKSKKEGRNRLTVAEPPE
jgi:diguanylate cyclase (GGDEF)-like protein